MRSEALARVLAVVLLSDDSLHVRAIAERAGLPYSTAQREVDRLEEAGIVRSARFATARVVRADSSYPYRDELRALLLKAYGPRELLEPLVRSLPGVERSFIFGSWARRYRGEWGAAPADVDLLLVGRPDERAVEDLAAEAEDLIGQAVQTTVVSPQEWQKPTSGFVRTLQSRPLVELPSDSE